MFGQDLVDALVSHSCCLCGHLQHVGWFGPGIICARVSRLLAGFTRRLELSRVVFALLVAPQWSRRDAFPGEPVSQRGFTSLGSCILFRPLVSCVLCLVRASCGCWAQALPAITVEFACGASHGFRVGRRPACIAFGSQTLLVCAPAVLGGRSLHRAQDAVVRPRSRLRTGYRWAPRGSRQVLAGNARRNRRRRV